MGRAARNAGFATVSWEPQAHASEGVCREPFLGLVTQCIGQGKVWAAFYDLHVALGPKLRTQRLEHQQPL